MNSLNRERPIPGAQNRSPGPRQPNADGRGCGPDRASLRRHLRPGSHRGARPPARLDHRENREHPARRERCRAPQWPPSGGVRRGHRSPGAGHGRRVFPGRPGRPADGHVPRYRRTDVCSDQWRRAPTGGHPSGAAAPVAVRHATRSRCHPLAMLIHSSRSSSYSRWLPRLRPVYLPLAGRPADRVRRRSGRDSPRGSPIPITLLAS